MAFLPHVLTVARSHPQPGTEYLLVVESSTGYWEQKNKRGDKHIQMFSNDPLFLFKQMWGFFLAKENYHMHFCITSTFIYLLLPEEKSSAVLFRAKKAPVGRTHTGVSDRAFSPLTSEL